MRKIKDLVKSKKTSQGFEKTYHFGYCCVWFGRLMYGIGGFLWGNLITLYG